MTLPVALHRKIVDFFTSLPMIDDRNGRRAFIHSVALDAQLQGQIEFPGSSRQFFELLVPQLVRYGQLKDGRHALETVLESAKNYVGQDRREDCERLLQELRAVSSLEVGVNEAEAEPSHVKTVTATSSKSPQVFLCYAREDRKTAKQRDG